MNILQKVEENLKEGIKEAIIKAELATEEEIPTILLEKPKQKEHGDFATNIAMQLAKIAKKAPRAIAEDITNELDLKTASVKQIDIAGPGFINLHMDHSYLTDIVPTIMKEDADYGKSDVGQGTKIQVEFVSANPTGDLHLGHARGAAVGDSLCNVLAAAGYDVEREYYINDAGNQIDNLALSVEARYMQALGQEKSMPEGGYQGKDIIKLSEKIVQDDGDKWINVSEEERLSHFREIGLAYELEKIKKDLEVYGVPFDHWFSETTLYQEGKVEAALDILRQHNVTYEADGATWFKTTDYGDDKDRVLVKTDGSYTYLAPDIAYHKNKLDRGFDKLINIWGADHHGYIPRMNAAIQALGYSADTLEVDVVQMVSLFEDGQRVKMSKRTGKAITLVQLMEEVGKDAMRYFFNMRSSDSHLDFDMDLARSESNENPVYYVQYAHARICSMLRQAEEKGFAINEEYNADLLTSEKELELLRLLGEFPQVIVEAAEKRIPHKITQYVFELSTALHSFYNAEKVLDENNTEQTLARIALIKAVRITLVNGLKIIGVSAPESM